MTSASDLTVDLLVVGAGVIGNSIAYHVARQGRSVLVVDRAQVAAPPSGSGASAGGIRRQGQHPAEAALADEAVARWPTLSDELDADLEYRQDGYLSLAETDDGAQRLASSVRREQHGGFADLALLDRRELLELVPGLADKLIAGAYSPRDGQADAALTTHAFATAAQRLGATYLTGSDHVALARHGNRVTGLRTSAGEVHAGQTVLAAGPWSAGLSEAIGIRLPVRVRALQMLRSTTAAPGRLHPVLGSVERALSLKQVRSGAFLVGGGWLADPTADARSYVLREPNLAASWATAVGVLPLVGEQRVERSWAGLQARVFDDLPLLGRLSAVDGLSLALGSWHGFGLAPAIGRVIADHLAGLPTPELAQLAPDRVADFDPNAVASFLAAPDTGDTLD